VANFFEHQKQELVEDNHQNKSSKSSIINHQSSRKLSKPFLYKYTLVATVQNSFKYVVKNTSHQLTSNE
jgi:hypothetical protein